MLFRNHSLLNLLHLITFLSGMVGLVSSKCLEHIKDVTPKRFFQVESDIWNITLETSSDLIGHQLVTNAFAIFLREVLGYESVYVVPHSDHFHLNSSSLMLERLSGMDFSENGAYENRPPESMINLGVWLPPDLPMVELERWNNPGIVENCGKLGFQGRLPGLVIEIYLGLCKFVSDKQGESKVVSCHPLFIYECRGERMSG